MLTTYTHKIKTKVMGELEIVKETLTSLGAGASWALKH